MATHEGIILASEDTAKKLVMPHPPRPIVQMTRLIADLPADRKLMRKIMRGTASILAEDYLILGIHQPHFSYHDKHKMTDILKYCADNYINRITSSVFEIVL